MSWIVTISPEDPIVLDFVKKVGPEGYLYLCKLLKRWVECNGFELTVESLRNICGINQQKSLRIFEETSKKFQESLEKLQESSKKFQKVPTFDALNPHGSTRGVEGNRIDLKERKKKSLRVLGTSLRQRKMSAEDDKADAEFEIWYTAYPHRVGKGQARKAYWKARETVSAEILLDGISRYRAEKPAYANWRNPATWLNGEGWLDKPASQVEPKPGNKKQGKFSTIPWY